jgi:hypothetical protein
VEQHGRFLQPRPEEEDADRFFLITRFRVSSDLAGAFNRSRSGGSLPVLVGPACVLVGPVCVLSLSVSDTLDPPPPLVPGSHEKDNVDAILKRGQHAVTTPT